MDKRDYLLKIYNTLLEHFGPQDWWPADTPFEVIIGAILTQNTSWKNVEKAMGMLKASGHFSPKGLYEMPLEKLATLLKPSGYFNIKARRLKNFLSFLFKEYQGDIDLLLKEDGEVLRSKLLSVTGIGPETADSILLYAKEYPVFVVDAYTKRILSRHGIISESATYAEVQDLFMNSLPHDPKLYNEYHALLVRVGKELCRRTPLCGSCPLEYDLYDRFRDRQNRKDKAGGILS